MIQLHNSAIFSSCHKPVYIARQAVHIFLTAWWMEDNKKDQAHVANDGKEGNKPVKKEVGLVYKLLDTFHSNFTTQS
jgi:hypothetical protein